MKANIKKIISSVLFVCVIISIMSVGIAVNAAEQVAVLPTDVTKPADDCVFLGIKGKYVTQSQKALDRINEIRYEACKQGVLNPSTGNPLKTSDYIAIKWSSDLEYIARIRAAEASLTMNHERTNGRSIWDLYGPDGNSSWGEVIAWNWSDSMLPGIEQWYGEKGDWVNQNTNAVTGHYTQMIDPENRYVGLGTFCSPTANYYNTTAGEFSSMNNMKEIKGSAISNCIQTLEVSKSILTNEYTLGDNRECKSGEKINLEVTTGISVIDYWNDKLITNGLLVLDPIEWSSSNESVASVSNGVVTTKDAGTATITAKTSNGKTATCKVTVTKVLATPTITNLQNTADGIRISWNKVSGAYGYRLYYKYPGKDWKRFKDTTSTSFTDTGVSAGRTETYTIRCIDKDGNTISGYNSGGWSYKYEPVNPTITKLENTSDGIKISWNKIAGVYGYRLYYKYPGKDWKRFKDTTATSFTDTGVSAGRTETYTIRCIDKDGNTISGYNSSGWSKKYEPITPTITKLENTSNGIKISWNKIAGVYGYSLYYKYPGKDWKRFKDTTTTSFTDTGVSIGRTETYTIRCIDKNGNTVSGYNSGGWSQTYSLPRSIPHFTKLENTSNGIKISWNKVEGVYGYRLYYKYPGQDWKRFKDTTATSFTDTGVSAGRTETYTIRCIDSNGNTFSGYNSDGWSKKYEPVAPTITKLEKTSNGVKISWNPVAGVYGYRLYYKYPGQDWKRFKDTTGTSFTDTGVKSGRTETYTIRCIDKNGNTISGYNPSGWSITYR